MKRIIFGGLMGIMLLPVASPALASESAALKSSPPAIIGAATDNRGVNGTIFGGRKAPHSPQFQDRPGFPQAEINPAIAADNRAYGWDDTAVVDSAAADTDGGNSEAGTYDGEWTGNYVGEDGRVYQGQWTGTYTGEDGRVYQGTYRGTATGEPVAGTAFRGGAQVPAPPPGNAAGAAFGGDAVPQGYERYERCLRGRGLTGGAIGAILGGILGNRIAGRGNRLAGTLLGGGLGTLAGVGIEKATNKCRKFLPQQSFRPAYYPQYGYGGQNGYYYYQPPAPTITTITVIPGTVTTTVETTEEIIHVPAAKRVYKGKRLRRPAVPIKRCSC